MGNAAWLVHFRLDFVSGTISAYLLGCFGVQNSSCFAVLANNIHVECRNAIAMATSGADDVQISRAVS